MSLEARENSARNWTDDQIAGADNLILCLERQGRLKGGVADKVISVIAEDAALGWYDQAISNLINERLRSKGATVRLLNVGAPEAEHDVAVEQSAVGKSAVAQSAVAQSAWQSVRHEMQSTDATIFLSRMGDMIRFSHHGHPALMSYVRNIEQAASLFGRVPHEVMLRVRGEVDRLCASARHIRVSCPLGTHLERYTAQASASQSREVGVIRFPAVIGKPILCEAFAGKVVVSCALYSTGSRVFEPVHVPLSHDVTVTIENGAIAKLEGDDAAVRGFSNHYDYVASLFDLDRNFVHSFHAGIHPGGNEAFLAVARRDNPDLWASSIFASPSYLHFHTCGRQPPGEISWMIYRPSIAIDNVPLWANGRVAYENFPSLQAILDESELLQEAVVN